MDSTPCSIRFCQNPSEAESPITCLPICRQHLQDVLQKCAESESDVSARIAHFRKCHATLRQVQQRLVSDLQLLDDTFHELRETLDKGQAELTAAITKHHDEVLEAMKLFADFDSFEKELQAAKEESDFRKAFCINESIKRPLENLALGTKLVHIDEVTGEVKSAAIPDVNSSISDLMNCAETQIDTTRIIVESLDASQIGKPVIKISDRQEEVILTGTALCMAVCSNTKGFALDDSDSIVPAQSVSDGSQLPQPAVFVGIHVGKKVPRESVLNYIIMVSTESSVKGRLNFCWDANMRIRDIYCDNERQLLYIAQKQAVTVANLSGTEQTKIATSDLQNDVGEIRCLTGYSDKLFVLTKTKSKAILILGLFKESNEFHLKLKMPEDIEFDFVSSNRIAVRDRMLLIADDDNVLTVCSITGLVISKEYFAQSNELSTGASGKLQHEKLLRWHFCKSQPIPRVSMLSAWLFKPAKVLKIEQNKDASFLLWLSGGVVHSRKIGMHVEYELPNSEDSSSRDDQSPVCERLVPI